MVWMPVRRPRSPPSSVPGIKDRFCEQIVASRCRHPMGSPRTIPLQASDFRFLVRSLPRRRGPDAGQGGHSSQGGSHSVDGRRPGTMMLPVWPSWRRRRLRLTNSDPGEVGILDGFDQGNRACPDRRYDHAWPKRAVLTEALARFSGCEADGLQRALSHRWKAI